jgi:hypothetical protein
MLKVVISGRVYISGFGFGFEAFEASIQGQSSVPLVASKKVVTSCQIITFPALSHHKGARPQNNTRSWHSNSFA